MIAILSHILYSNDIITCNFSCTDVNNNLQLKTAKLLKLG